MDYLRDYNSQVNSVLSPLDSPVPASLLRLLLIVYAGLVAPALPDKILKFFDFVPFRILILFLICWTASKDPTISILIAIGFYTSLNALSGKKLFEQFTEVQGKD
jgi:hypothetical protein